MSLKKNYEAKFVSRIKNLEEDENGDLIIEGWANTVSKDRAGDVIPAETWRKAGALDNYRNNPILLAFHDHSNPIGRVIELEVREQGLYVRAKVSKGAGNVHELIKDGTLSTFSVGFIIKDANYDGERDIYFITEVELLEISVVSVPCNQDSTFSVAKSLAEYEKFKSNFNKENKTMTKPFDIEAFRAEMLEANKSVITSALQEQEAAKEAAKAKAEADRLAAEKAEKNMKTTARVEAEALVAELKNALNEKDGVFAETVKAQAEQITELRDEIASLVNSSRRAPVGKAVNAAITGVAEKDIDVLVMLGMIKNMPIDQTRLGKKHFAHAAKAVNSSSSIQVSSEAYETEFSTNLIRDIQAELVIAPLFQEITMNTANLTIPINPSRRNATWVDSTDFGKAGSSGSELSVALTEKTLKTFKLAAKVYLTEETDEDVIIAMVPILRQHLVEAHANAIDTAFLLGSGTGQPKGLVKQAEAASIIETSTANMSTKVTAKMILKGRRKLGLFGVNRSDLVAIVSQDAYWDLIEDDEWADVNLVGAEYATKLKGEVGNVYGMPVLVSNAFEAKALDKTFAVIVNKTNFMVARQRGATVKTDFDVEKDRRVFVATQRLNLEPLIEESAGNGKGVVAIQYAAA